MKDPSCEADERKIADIIKKWKPNLACRVIEDPRTEICRVFIGRKVIIERMPDELDDPANVLRFLGELEQRLRLFKSGKL